MLKSRSLPGGLANVSNRPVADLKDHPVNEREALESDLWLKASVAPWRTTTDRPLRKRISDRLPAGRTMLLQRRREQLLVGCAQSPRRPILCRRHSERG